MTPSHPSRKVEAGCRAGQGRRAFSLIEILTTVALLSFIILGLVAMFNQTRKAFTSSFTQVDVLESGRMAADMIGREMEQMYPAYGNSNIYNFVAFTPSTYTPLVQPLVDPNDIKINNLQEIFFVTRSNMQWSCIGYRLGDMDYAKGIGTLYHYNSTNIPTRNISDLLVNYNYFANTDPAVYPTNFSRIIDGVVDFRVRLYDTNGVVMTNTNSLFPTIYIYGTNSYATYYGTPQYAVADYMDYVSASFSSNAIPGYVELELGVLEDRSLAKYQALTNGNDGPGSPAYNYLTNHAGQVHVFRQRIPIRNVNSSAFP